MFPGVPTYKMFIYAFSSRMRCKVNILYHFTNQSDYDYKPLKRSRFTLFPNNNKTFVKTTDIL